LSIDELTCGLDFTPEVGVANRLFSDEINMSSEKTLEFLSKPDISVSVESRRLPIRHLDDEVEIARRLNELPGCGRAEEIEAFNAVSRITTHCRRPFFASTRSALIKAILNKPRPY
jgi:hypothetical protein